MKKTAMVMLALLMVAILTATAAAQEYGIMQAVAYYKHPVTGVIEDPGNNEGIGQGMCENVLHSQALLENIGGQLFVTVRYNLYNYIEGVEFAVQNRGDDAFYKVPHTVLNVRGETADLRFQIPSQDAVVRSAFYVGPMGRDVVFYFDFKGYTPGNTDFILQETADAPPTGTPAASAQSTAAPEASAEPTQAPMPVDASTLGEKVEVQAVNQLMEATDLGYNHGLLTKDSPELKPIIAKIHGEAPEEVPEETPETPAYVEPGFFTKALFIWLLAIVGGLILILADKVFAVKLGVKR